MKHVRAIARVPHPMGTVAIGEVRAYIASELGKLGLEARLQRFTAPDFHGQGEPVSVVNIIARLPGTASTRSVALLAHYDTVPTTPGANDNSAAVATLLETARALRRGPPLQNDVLLLLTDGEEPRPRYGARRIAQEESVLDEIGLVVNLEASGGCGASVLAETSGPERWLIEELAASGAPLSAFSFLCATSRLMGDIGTDFDVFRNAGVAGLHFAYIQGSPIYHTMADDIESVSRASLQHHGEYALRIAGHFGNLGLGVARTDEGAVYFPVGPLFVHHPASWALPLAAFAGILALLATWRRRVTPASGQGRAARDLVRRVAGGVLALILGTLAWLAVTAVRTTPGVLESYLCFVSILLACAWIARVAAGRRDGTTGAFVACLFALLALSTAAWLPGWSYLFAWPAIAASAALLLPRGRNPWVPFVIVSATTSILMTPAIALLFQFAQPRPGNPGSEMRSVIALPLLLALLSLGLLRAAWPRADGAA